MSDCICYITPEKYWTTHYGAVEPGSQMEPNPECPEHFPESSKPMSENMNTPSDPRVGEIQARLDAATPGPWYVDDEEQTVRAREYAGEIVYDRSAEHPSEWTKNFKPTAEFIAAAPADVAYLLAELRDRDEKLARVEGPAESLHVAPSASHPHFAVINGSDGMNIMLTLNGTPVMRTEQAERIVALLEAPPSDPHIKDAK